MNSACRMRRRNRRRIITQQATALLLASLIVLHQSLAQDTEPLPSFEELEAEGAIIGEIRIDNQNIFDLSDPEENNVLYRLANKLHIRTRQSVIRRQLLFTSGEPVSVQRIDETERLLRENSYLYEVHIRPIAYHDGVVDIEVVTRDTWTLDPGLGFSRKGGENKARYGLKELNLFGTGTAIEWERNTYDEGNIDAFRFNNNQLFGSRVRLDYLNEDRYDGNGQSISLARPFYSLETRWAAGVEGSIEDRLVSTYNNGILASQYQRNTDAAGIYGGWSKGLVDGWTRRYFVGIDYVQNSYELVPGQPPPTELPTDEIRVSPFLRYQVVENEFEKTENRREIGRVEYFRLGFASDIKLGYAMTALGSTRPAWSYLASVSKGWNPSGDQILVAAGSVSGLYTEGDTEDQFLAGAFQYFIPQSGRSQTYIALGFDAASDVDQSNQLTLGGENGLPGYPTDYQTGDRRVLFNIEQRVYTNWFPFRLFRVGGAVFFDAGRAWGGEFGNTEKPGWLADVGFGLRIFSVRSAFGSVFHIDFAFPINPVGDIPSSQFLIYRTRAF